jgi:hypothetical protein
MSAPKQSPEEAINLTNLFIDSNLHMAKSLSGSGTNLTPNSLVAFADAEHALTDEGSPEHRDPDGTPKVWTGSSLGYPLHIYGESDEQVDWYGFGQSIRKALVGLALAFPEKLNPSDVGSVAAQRIWYAVGNYYATHSSGNMRMSEDAARLCAMGNRAACD